MAFNGDTDRGVRKFACIHVFLGYDSETCLDDERLTKAFASWTPNR